MDFRVAVCDDDERVGNRIRELLKGNLDKYLIELYKSGEELIKSKKKYDIIFLDIEMGKLNGLRTAKILRDEKRDDYIIFLTSHIELMSEAFKVKAFRFLSKPIQEKNFFEALREAENEILNDEKVIVPSDGEKHYVPQKNIMYIESLGDGSCIYTKDGQFVTGKTLKYWEENINHSLFFKVHKSYIIGLTYVKSIAQTEVVLNQDEIVLPISRRNKSDFEKAYMQFVKQNARSL